MQSSTEEDYLKAIFKLSKETNPIVSTNAIADKMNTKASSVTDMLKKLSEKSFVEYKKYKGVKLLPEGKKVALKIIRKHRLWEVFLVDKLKFNWDEIHEIAEQLEHIKSPELIDRLDEHLNFPKVDPHGDPIPDKDGNFNTLANLTIDQLSIGQTGVLIGVKESGKDFLNYLDKLNLKLGSTIEVINKMKFDKSLIIKEINGKETTISERVANNLNMQLL